MRFNRRDKSGGAGAAIFAILILLVLAFLGATWGMPFVLTQNIAAGDTLVYSTTETVSGVTTSYTETLTFNNVSSTQVDISRVDSDGFSASTTVSLTHEGNMVYLAMSSYAGGYFVASSDLPAERSYTVVMVGFTPMLVESYVAENAGVSYEFYVKAGTLLIVKWIATDGSDTISSTLTGSSMSWVTLI